MATRRDEGGASAPSIPLDMLLSAIPSLPRSVLDRLTAQLIDHLDEMDGDPDLEDSETGCPWVDERGQWCGPGPIPDGPWYEDDEAEEDCGADNVGEDCDGGDVCDDRRPIADPQAYREQVRKQRAARSFKLNRVRAAPWGYQGRMLYREPVTPTTRSLLRRKRGMPRRPRA